MILMVNLINGARRLETLKSSVTIEIRLMIERFPNPLYREFAGNGRPNFILKFTNL